MFKHLFIMIFLLCVCRDLTGKQLESIFTKSKGKRAFTSFRFRNRSEAKSSGFQKIWPTMAKKCVKFRKSERDHESDWKSGAAQKVDQSSNASDGNLVFFNQISKIISNDLKTCWNAYDGDMQRPVIYQQQLWAAPSLSSPFLWLALVQLQPSCSRWICSALRRNGSWQA